MSMKVANLHFDFVDSHITEEGRKVQLLHLAFVRRMDLGVVEYAYCLRLSSRI